LYKARLHSPKEGAVLTQWLKASASQSAPFFTILLFGTQHGLSAYRQNSGTTSIPATALIISYKSKVWGHKKIGARLALIFFKRFSPT
jgi:hypothetical protein